MTATATSGGKTFSSRAQTWLTIRAILLTSFVWILKDTYKGWNTYDTYTKVTQQSECPVAGAELRSVSASAAPVEKNLVAFVALGSRSSIATVHHNVHAHFLGWDCIVFVHRNETEIPPSDPLVKEIRTKCSIVQLPGLYWIHFLMTLTPELVRQYKYISVVLDDLFAPIHGDSAVSMPKLLQRMERHNLSSISPSIKGATWPSTRPRKACLWHVHVIETYFQIFTRDLFICWHSFMHYSNLQGWCLDACLHNQLCPSISNLAVDTTMIAYHLGRTPTLLRDFVPESALVGTNLTEDMYRPTTAGDLTMCTKLKCPNKIPRPERIKCYQ